MNTNKPFITVGEYSEIVGMAKKSVYQIIEAGRMDKDAYVKVGRSIRMRNPLWEKEGKR